MPDYENSRAATKVLRSLAASRGSNNNDSPFVPEKVSEVTRKANGHVFTIDNGTVRYTVYVTGAPRPETGK